MSEELLRLKEKGEAPEWLDVPGFTTLKNGYLLEGETPRTAYLRVAKAVAQKMQNPSLEAEVFEACWKNWVCLATPVMANMGSERGLPISCLTGDSWVITEDGAKQMENLEIGDKVLTHKGRFRPVTAKKSRYSEGDLFNLKIATRLTPLKITGNHPVLTNHGWVRVDELDPSKHLVAVDSKVEHVAVDVPKIKLSKHTPYKYEIRDNRVYKAIENNGPPHKKKKNGIVEYYASPFDEIELTKDLAWAIGLWLAEGSKSTSSKKEPNGLRITMNVGEKSIVEKWSDIMQTSFGVNGSSYVSEVKGEKVSKSGIQSWVNCNVNSKALAYWFCEEFGVGCKNKKLPRWFMNLPLDYLEAFFKGVLDGDGHKTSSGNWALTLSNSPLLHQCYIIALKLGYVVTLNLQTKSSHWSKDRYVYKIYLHKTNERLNLPLNNMKTGVEFGGLRFCRVVELKPLPKNEEVYDISVEEDNSFSVHGVVVHNCNSNHVADSLTSILKKNVELGVLSKYGAGVGIYLGDLRSRGSVVKGTGGISDGVIAWARIYDATIHSVSQGATRRGAGAVYLPVDHGDIDEFLPMRRPVGDLNKRCLNLNHGVCLPDDFMHRAIDGDKRARHLWKEILQTRMETGEPYLFFTDNVNRQAPECFQKNGLKISTSNICTEIFLPTDQDHTFVCCLLSLNVARWDEWKNSTVVQTATKILDAVLTEYIDKAKHIEGFEAAVRFAEKSRAIGIGVLGWHTLLQSKMVAFDSFEAMMLNAAIFRTIREQSEIATKELAEKYGEPEWCKGFGRRNATLMAVAPTVSNSTISGGMSAGIEPIAANMFVQKSAKGTFIRKNKILERVLEEKGLNTEATWHQISKDGGSVQNLKGMSAEEKEVFMTAKEINQFAIIKQAAQRQKWIDQGQSINLFFGTNSDPKYIHEVHLEAWKQGLKSLYYCRSESVIRADLASRQKDECKACEG
jgi:ribonucleoside-diphosphate reductase alpha chain